MGDCVKKLVGEELAAAAEFLTDLIRFPSLPGQEQPAIDYVRRAFEPLVDGVDPIGFPVDFERDPEYSCPLPNLSYDRRFNLRAVINEAGPGKSLIFCTHVDVVPASENQPRAFDPVSSDGAIFGRGACDAKGQVAALFLMLRVMKRLGHQPAGTLVLHLVVEEEIGGNGALGMIRTGEKADGAVVLEPTSGAIVTSVRGAVWFRIVCRGRPGHSGSPGQTASALKAGVEAMHILEKFHQRLLTESRGIALFDELENPMPINFGKLHSGNWPTSAPDRAVLEGVMGFLPNVSREWVMAEMECELHAEGSPLLANNFSLEFTYRHDSHVTPVDHPLVKTFQQSCRDSGGVGSLGALPASCDSWFYSNLLQIPTVVYGPGHLRFAHSAEEQIGLSELACAGETLTHLVLNWC